MPIDIMLRNCIFAGTTQQFLNMDVSIYNRIVCCTSVTQKWFWSSVRSIGSYGFILMLNHFLNPICGKNNNHFD